MNTPGERPAFTRRLAYVNHGEHLLNAWNANMLDPAQGNAWSRDDWRDFLNLLKHFGYTGFEYWLVPTMFDLPSLRGGGKYEQYAGAMREVADLAHATGLEIHCLCSINVWGPQWFYACPHDPEQKNLLLRLWRHWMRELSGLDGVVLFPGDLGGCNLRGCTHETAIDLDLEIAGIIQEESPGTQIEIGTWGTPFCGWGEDAVAIPGWNQAAMSLMRSGFYGWRHRDWHGTRKRADAAFAYLASRLPAFPPGTSVAVNPSLDPFFDEHINPEREGAAYARQLAELCPVHTWNYYVSEGEGTVAPHWTVPRMLSGRRQEQQAAPYAGGICYSMSPRLNLLTLYGGAQSFINPRRTARDIARDFSRSLWGPRHEAIGDLLPLFGAAEADEALPEYIGLTEGGKTLAPAREQLHQAYGELTERLTAARHSQGEWKMADGYTADLMWFAGKYYELTGPRPDRAQIAWDYWQKCYGIYDRMDGGSLTAEPSCRAFAARFPD